MCCLSRDAGNPDVEILSFPGSGFLSKRRSGFFVACGILGFTSLTLVFCVVYFDRQRGSAYSEKENDLSGMEHLL